MDLAKGNELRNAPEQGTGKEVTAATTTTTGEAVHNARKALELEDPAVRLLVTKCRQMTELTTVQVLLVVASALLATLPTLSQIQNCIKAATTGNTYEAATNRIARSTGTLRRTVQRMHDELKHEHGLILHAVGGVGMRVVTYVACAYTSG